MHPRFKNFYSSFTETGLGLCCEEAARVILSDEEKFFIELPKDVMITDEEKEFFKKRQEIFLILQDREKSISERFYELSEKFGFKFDFSLNELIKHYLSLERIDEKWTDELNNLNGYLSEVNIFDEEKFKIPFEQLSIYFIFRHLDKAIYDNDYQKKVRFSMMSCYLIGAVCSKHKDEYGEVSLEFMIDVARRYSSEVEYAEENINVLLLTS